jgi:2-succinyl-5-enolpyruvyl-6-hydroxy-3-cyclohexene-1-carboxylate synthase
MQVLRHGFCERGGSGESTRLARNITRQLIENGVTDVVLSPGSRNAPLSIALYAADQKGLLKLHVRIDERSAGFFALGISKATARPVAVVCTSGTAVANYHPAVLEARHYW